MVDQRITVRHLAGILIALACIGPGGCSRQPAPVLETRPTSPQQSAAISNATPANSAPEIDNGTNRDARTRWIGNVPYDVFFDRPLETYQQSAGATTPGRALISTASETATAAPTTLAEAETPPHSTTAETAAPSTAPNGAPSAIDWGTVAPIAQLEAETKAIRTRLSAHLQTVATFNANTDAIETDGSVLALIAAIIERHPDSINWKDRAPFVRQLAYDIYTNATGKGRGPLQKTKEPFEKIVAIWDGGPAPEMEAAALAPLGEAGDRSQIMLRFETGFNWLRSDVNTATRLKEEKDQVARETSVLAALATALGDPTFDAADQEAYRALLQQFVDGQQAMQRAAQSDDFPGFEQARDSVQKSCDACHLEFRNSSDSNR